MAPNGLEGLTVAAFESRMATEMANLITRFGGTPLVAPSMQEIPLEDNTQALEFGEQLMAGDIQLLVFLTGVGTRTLMDVLETRWSHADILQAMSKLTLVVRGPKPLAVLKSLGLPPPLLVPEPNTWEDVLTTLDTHYPKGLANITVGLQEYGVANPELIEGLTTRGAQVVRIPIYRWTLPDDIGPLQQVIEKILAQEVDVMLLTNAVQFDHMLKMLPEESDRQKLQQAMTQMVIGSIGQITSARLRDHNFPIDFEPSHPKMGVLVKEISEQIARLKK
ncbi:MAG: uroporphyrinogen-III synthase [Nitrospirae bacterium]|nr:uroporphyrinogen-III synthase [Nitrospirota bacterium]